METGKGNKCLTRTERRRMHVKSKVTDHKISVHDLSGTERKYKSFSIIMQVMTIAVWS